MAALLLHAARESQRGGLHRLHRGRREVGVARVAGPVAQRCARRARRSEQRGHALLEPALGVEAEAQLRRVEAVAALAANG